jgi:hypothetical protein
MVMAVYNHVYPGTALVGGGGKGRDYMVYNSVW